MKKGGVLLFILLSFYANAQIITTFAGNGHSSFSGDHGPAILAGIPNAVGGIFDKNGNYYFADRTAKRVRKIDVSGIITTIAGGGLSGDGGPATAAMLNGCGAVKLDTLGNLYICESANNKIRKVDIISGIISTVAGTGIGGYGLDGIPATASMLWDPQDICLDKFGNLYVSEAFSYRVRKISPSGMIFTFAGTGTMGYSGDNSPATSAQLDAPAGLASDDTGNIYIADPGSFSNRVRKVNLFGTITTIVGNGTATYIGDEIPATNAQIAPYQLALDEFNNIYISDYYNQRVYKIDSDNIIHNIAGNGVAGGYGDGGAATAASLYSPSGVAVDACGNVYIPEVGNVSVDSFRNIRKVAFNPPCDPALNISNANDNAKISIYPNPINDLLHIDNVNTNASYTLLTIAGTTVRQGSLQQGSNTVPLGSLPPGIYMLVVKPTLVSASATGSASWQGWGEVRRPIVKK